MRKLLVSEKTYNELAKLKKKERAKSFNSLIDNLATEFLKRVKN